MGYELEFWQYLVVCPLIFLAGIIDAIGGGGGLVTLPSYMLVGLPVHFAIGTNKLSSVMGTAMVTGKYFRDGYIPVKIAACSVIFAMIGSSLGARTALLISDRIFKIIMLIVLPLTAIYVFKSQNFMRDRNFEAAISRRTFVISILVAFFLGFYDGFYGPGAGTFMLLLLAGIAGLSLQHANGVAKVINLATNLAAVTVFLLNNRVIIPLGLTAGIFSIAGNYIGAKFFEKGGAKVVRPVILIVLVIFFVRVLYDVIF